MFTFILLFSLALKASEVILSKKSFFKYKVLKNKVVLTNYFVLLNKVYRFTLEFLNNIIDPYEFIILLYEFQHF
ncbi:hypothetical protein LEP1GSC186_1724 [Leptospira noguchii serovar Autumnalis str. ZUN142]|uniref:Uncharacterized protein n=1 Tax=Leptospira noguchii serovar Autumnalis str. ZUN142 TaxID=1085540 RepID=M6URP6_9LEPT|nr:hypothetical protein LEP1GSC186_1724 [Leptospira noguchii serovar Autumnalis str. ZUN142]